MRSLEERVRELEDIEAIRRLKLRYAQLCDAGYDAYELAELYTEDGVWDTGSSGTYHGRAAIREFWETVPGRFSFALHYMIGHEINVDPSGMEATGSWYLLEPATVEGRAVWFAATYSDRYQKVDGNWLFSHVKLDVAFSTPHDTGWVKERFIDVGSGDGPAADEGRDGA